MKNVQDIKITTAESIAEFLFDIYLRCDKVCDPASDLKAWKNENGQPVFRAGEAEVLDNLMTDCFIYCIYNDLDIYKIAFEVQQNIFKRLSAA